MNKNVVLIILLFTFFNINAQFDQEEADLYSVSEELLAKNVSIYFGGGKLKDVLDLIAKHNAINISYSDNRIAPINISAISIDQKSLSYVLEQLLNNTDLDYMIVGRIVLIVENKNISTHPNDTSYNATNTTSPFGTKNHIYTSGNSINKYISAKQKRIINRIHRKELKWAATNNPNTNDKTDTLHTASLKPKLKLINLNAYQHLEDGMYIHSSLKTDIHKIKINNLSGLNWQEKLQYEIDARTSFYPEIGVGYRYNNWMIMSGLSYKRLIVKERWVENIKKGSNSDKASKNAKGKNEEQTYSSLLNNRIISLPVKIHYTHFIGNTFIAIGAGTLFSYLKNYRNDLYILEDYYNDQFTKDKTSLFNKKEHKTMFSGFIEANAGVLLAHNLMIFTGLNYQKAFTPFYSNTITQLSVNSVSISISINYFLK